MRMPGFTAERSLYDASERYRHVVERAVGAASGDVIPQSERVLSTDDGCWVLDCFYDDRTGAWLYCDVIGPLC